MTAYSRSGASDGFSYKAPLARSMATATSRISTGMARSATSTSTGGTTTGIPTTVSSPFATFTDSPEKSQEFYFEVDVSNLRASFQFQRTAPKDRYTFCCPRL
jgi:hypothetical protein